MPMPPYPIYCYSNDCKNLAVYKIAARWSDGLRSELKTYCLCCDGCLKTWFFGALERQRNCRLAPGESIAVPAVFQLVKGQRDQQLHRLEELEKELLAGSANPA